jgi:hypothetical protein
MGEFVTIDINFMGDEFALCAEYEVMDFGYPSSRDEPGADPEWDVTGIWLQGDGAEWRVETGTKQFRLLANLPKLDEAIMQQIEEIGDPLWRDVA